MNTQEVQEAASQLVSETWDRRGVPGELERVAEIQELIHAQLRDDTYSISMSRIGRSYVLHGSDDDGDEMYTARPPEDLALETAFSPILNSELTGEQRVLLRMIYSGRDTWRQVADQLHITHQAVGQRLKVIHKLLRTAVIEAFGSPGLSFDPPAPREDPWKGEWDGHLTEIEEPAWLDEPYVPVEHIPVDHLIFRGAPQHAIVRTP